MRCISLKIIVATWERRNFGIDAYEILLDKKDLRNFDEIFKEIQNQNFKNAYVVVKMPVGNLKALHTLEDDGYRFLETQLYLIDHFKPKESDIEILGSISEYEQITIDEVPKIREKWEEIIQKITPGVFDTDRVGLDPILGEEIACKRYQNWCRDLFDNPHSVMYARKINGEICGFGIELVDKISENVNSILGCIFKEYKHIGIGTSWINEHSNNKKTAVSSNNISAIKIHQHTGRIIYKMRYVLRKKYD